MDTTNKRWMQLSVFAVAVLLAIVAVAAVMMAAGGSPAQATTAATSAVDGVGGNPVPPQQQAGTPTPRHATPEPCPGETGNTNTEAAHVVDSGHIALFDVWWNTEEGELTNTSCPPTVVHVPGDPGDEEEERPATPARDDRYLSNINIEQTVIHIPNSAKIDLSDSNTPYPRTEYKAVWDADDEENPDGDGDRMVWALPACPPDGSPATNGLCLSFSAALLHPADWGDTDNRVRGDGKVRFRIVHVDHLNTGGQDGGAVLAYHVPGTDTPVPYAAAINSSNANHGAVEVTPGEYERPVWFFTRTGRYEFQMHVTGHPERNPAGGRSAVSPDPAVSSAVQTYTFYVGPLTLNRDPVFGIERSVPENSAGGVAVGRPVPVLQQDSGDTHTFNLTGSGSDKFTLSTTGDGVQIAVADGVTLNYEDASSYDLDLTVSDGKDRFSHGDASVDDTIPVRILVEDDPNERFAITLEADRTTQTIGQGVRLTASISNSPVSSDRLSYRHHEQNVGGGRSLTELTHDLTRTVTWDGDPVSREYTMTVFVTGTGHGIPEATSEKVVIAWTR